MTVGLAPAPESDGRLTDPGRFTMTRKKPITRIHPSASRDDLASPEALRAAFERERPRREPSNGLWRPTAAESEALKGFGTFVRSALTALLGAEPASEPRAFGSWNPVQQALLEEIARTPHELHLNALELGRILERSGAILVGGVDDDRYLARYVGLRPASALEREIGGRPLWLWLRLRLMDRVPRDAWLAVATTLEPPARFDLARRSLENAYQLMRRWPLPASLTREVERDDAARLDGEILASLASSATGDLQAELARELARPTPVQGWVVVLCLALVDQGIELPGELEPVLSDALGLSTTEAMGRELLRALPEARRRRIVEAIGLHPYNVDGWVYLDLLALRDRSELVAAALAAFSSALSPVVVPCLTALVRGFDAAARAALRDVAERGGPNEKLLKGLLASSG